MCREGQQAETVPNTIAPDQVRDLRNGHLAGDNPLSQRTNRVLQMHAIAGRSLPG